MRISANILPLWPVHPPPSPDELLSSWMVRLAHLNGHKVHSFYALYFGKERQIWNRDIDRLAPAWLLEGLAAHTGTPMSRIMETTLLSLEGRLFERHTLSGNTRWLLPLGIYHRTSRRFGLQYCPQCLAEDATPYFRASWRLALSTACFRHDALLRDRCPDCDSPIMFWRTDMSSRSFGGRHALQDCIRCGGDLAQGPATPALWPTTRSRRLAFVWSRGFRAGWLRLSRDLQLHSLLAYPILHQICRLLLTARTERGLSGTTLTGRLGLIADFTSGCDFYDLSSEQRHALMNTAIWILDDWPLRFIALAQEAGLSSAWLLKDMRRPIPLWYEKVVIEHFYTPNPPYQGDRPSSRNCSRG